MSSIGTGYDLSASQFSPDGRVFQVEYAQKAVENSGTIIGLKGEKGVVLAVEKLVASKLYEVGSNPRIFTADRHAGLALAGLLADARQLAQTARSEAANYRSEYGGPQPLHMLTDRLAMNMHAYTLYSAIRPFGCSALLSGWDKTDGPQLFGIEPSGVSCGYSAVAVGKARQAAKTELEKLKLSNMTMVELVYEAARIIYVVHDEVKDKSFELELSWVSEETKGLHQRVPDALHKEAEQKAKASVREDSDSDNEV